MTALIVAAAPENNIEYIRKLCENVKIDYIICADGGIEKLHKLSVKADIHIGDFDSSECDNTHDVIRYPCEKDWTDTESCIEKSLELGCDTIYLTGIMGGRADHMMSNLLSLLNPDYDNIKIFGLDSNNIVTKLVSGIYEMPRGFKYMSIVPVDEILYGVTLKGVKYPLDRATMYRYKSLGISNEVTAKYAEVTVEKGSGLLIFSKDAK